jgi:hypothetical protein
MEATQGTPITAQVQHDGVNTDSYSLYLDSTLHGTLPVSPEGVQWIFEDGLPMGDHQLYVKATGPAGSVDSDPVLLTVTPQLPGKPVLLIILGSTGA